MKKMYFLLLSMFLLVVFVLASCGQTQNGQEETNNEAQDEVIKIGFIGPLSGGLASLGVDMKNAVAVFVEENPTFGGKKVEMIYEDDLCDPSKSVDAANKLINSDKVQVIFVNSCSGPYLAVAPIANQSKVLIISSLSTSPDITLNGGDFGFRNAPSDELASTVTVDYMAGKYKKIALISENTDFSQAYRQKVKEKAIAKGMEVVFDEAFNPDTTDFKTTLTKMKEMNPEALVNLSNSGVTAGIISKQRYELGINIPEFGTDVMTSREYPDTAKEASEGMIIAVTAADESKIGVQQLLEVYKTKYGMEASNPAYVVLAYDAVNIIKNAIEAVGYDGVKIKDWLYSMPEYDGLGGKTKFDANGDSSILPSLMVMKGGKLELIK